MMAHSVKPIPQNDPNLLGNIFSSQLPIDTAARTHGKSVRTFPSGATRDTAEGKYEYTGFLSPTVLKAFAAYMHHHRYQADGMLRDADNWKKNMPKDECLKSLFRHVMDLWLIMETGKSIRPETGEEVTLDEAFGGIFFNNQILWHQHIQEINANGRTKTTEA
jgi:hypothetical protein